MQSSSIKYGTLLLLVLFQGVSASSSSSPIALLLAKNYRRYLPNNATRLCETGCDDANEECLVSYGFLPSGVCLSAYVRNSSTTYTLEPETGAVCQRLYSDRSCQTLATEFPFQDETRRCHSRWEQPNQCHRATQYTVLEDFCVASGHPVENYTVPMIETGNYPALGLCQERSLEGVGNAFRLDHTNLCQPTVNIDTEFARQAGSMRQYCQGHRLETVYYTDINCTEASNATQLALPSWSGGGCQEHPIWSNLWSTSDCASPPQYHCQDLSLHEQTKEDFFHQEVVEEEDEEETLDLYVKANWHANNGDHSQCNCTQTTENGCVRSYDFLLEGRCINSVNQETSSRYYTLASGQVCRLHYSDRDCTQEAYLDNAADGGCNFLATPTTCAVDHNANSSSTITTRLPNHCVYATEPRGVYTQPMVTVRTYPTLQDCQGQNQTSSFAELITIGGSDCRKQTTGVCNVAHDSTAQTLDCDDVQIHCQNSILNQAASYFRPSHQATTTEETGPSLQAYQQQHSASKGMH